MLPHVINAGVFTSAFSAGNSYLYSSSRILFGLSVRGQAPKIFSRVTKGGLPLISVAFCVSLVSLGHSESSAKRVFGQALFSLLTFMTVSNGAATVFGWLVNLTTVGGFVSSWTINVTYLFFRGFPFVLLGDN